MSISQTQNLLNYFEEKKNKHLFYSIAIDVLGMLTMAIPFVGAALDIMWAPISGILIFAMYKTTALKAKAGIGGFIGFVEELLPVTDIVPTATLMWAYTYVVQKDKTLSRIAKRRFKDHEIVNNLVASPSHPGLWKRIKAVFKPSTLHGSQLNSGKEDELISLPEENSNSTEI